MIPSLALASSILLLTGCGGVGDDDAANGDADADADADADTDADTDADSDGDTDSDADGDSDADTDGDVDADADADGDADPPECVSNGDCGDGVECTRDVCLGGDGGTARYCAHEPEHAVCGEGAICDPVVSCICDRQGANCPACGDVQHEGDQAGVINYEDYEFCLGFFPFGEFREDATCCDIFTIDVDVDGVAEESDCDLISEWWRFGNPDSEWSCPPRLNDP